MLRKPYIISFLASCLLLCAISSKGQFQKPFYLEYKQHYGFLSAHRPSVNYLSKSHITPMEISYLQKGKTKPWHTLFGNPYGGFTLFFSDFNNPEHLGWGIGLASHVSLHLYKSERSELNMRLGSGLGYVSKIFDSENNYKNLAVGSKLNLFAIIQVESRIQLSDRTGLVFGIGGTHYSNAAAKMPNLGYNFLSTSAGVFMRIGEERPEVTPDPVARNEEVEFVIAFGAGAKENYPIDGPTYFASTLMIEAIKPLGSKSKVALGTDVFYNRSIMQYMDGPHTTFGDIIQNSIKGGYELHINALSFMMQMGVYVRTKYKGTGRIYHRIGGRIRLKKNLHINISLKTHFARADFLETGIAYNFRR